MSKYDCISLPKELVRIVDEKIQGKGYSSRAEFVKQAIRRELERIMRRGA